MGAVEQSEASKRYGEIADFDSAGGLFKPAKSARE